MVAQIDIVPLLDEMTNAAPSGFALALHINFTTPRFLLQTYSDEWISHYSENGMVMSDPTVLWGFENDGTKKWSDLASLDTAGVMKSAADFGLKYGIVIALEENGSRSIGSFARSDREFDEAETALFVDAMTQLHNITSALSVFDTQTTADLKAKKVRVAQAAG